LQNRQVLLGGSYADIQQINTLFYGLKEDNERLASEIRKLSNENLALIAANEELHARNKE